MRLPEGARDHLTQELRFVVEKMRGEPEPSGKLYFFSAGYGEAMRILNIGWDAELCLINIVLQATYSAINGRLQAIATGADRGIKLPEGFFDALAGATSELVDVIDGRHDDKLCEALARFAELVYLTTGNGYYLYVKGTLRPQGLREP